jgi:N-acetylmuramoyl-L-alanine amidase
LPSPVTPLTLEYVKPGSDSIVIPGDEIAVSAKGSPGMQAYFTVGGGKKQFPLIEGGSSQGFYSGIYVVGTQDKLNNTFIQATLIDTKTDTKITKKADGLISFIPDTAPLIAETTAYANLHAGPAIAKGNGAGYYMSLPKGVRLRITGSKGDEFRVRLNRTKEAWISRGSVKLLPSGTLPGQDAAGNIVISGRERSTEISIPLGRKVPFEVQPDMDGKYIDVIIYGAFSNTDFMNYLSTGIVEQVQWFQDDPETYRLRAYTPTVKWWGYDARYEGGTLVLEVRNPPPAYAGSNLPLAGVTIAVDAGHSPDSGAVGVTGLLERDANLNIAKILKKKLSALGARVVMTREGPEPVELYSRPVLAWQARADIFVSVHNNALGDGENPLKKNGYEIYYFHPLSFSLAAEIHKAYGELVGTKGPAEFKLRDDGLRYGNFVITRTIQMPSVLTESAYMIVPREEALLKTEKFQSACAESIARGIVRYMNHMRPAAARKNIQPAAKKKK